MNIQPSVAVWTIICFILLMIVLRNLLFKPVLSLLDRRKEIMAQAEKKKDLEREITQEHEKRLKIIASDAEIQRENYIRSELEIIRVSSKNDIEKLKASRLKKIEDCKTYAEKEKEEIINHFNSSRDDIVKAFADRIISQH